MSKQNSTAPVVLQRLVSRKCSICKRAKKSVMRRTLYDNVDDAATATNGSYRLVCDPCMATLECD